MNKYKALTNIYKLIIAGEESLKNENYYSAMVIALLLPGMCARIEFCGNKNYYSFDKSNEMRYKDKLAYIDFCKTCFGMCGLVQSILGSEFADLLYSIRCNLVHEGKIEGDYTVKKNGTSITLLLSNGCISKVDNDKVQIKMGDICKEVLVYVQCWFMNNVSFAPGYYYSIVNYKFQSYKRYTINEQLRW